MAKRKTKSNENSDTPEPEKETETMSEENDSTFDPDLFMSEEVDQASETKYPTIPDGDYIVSSIDEVKKANFKEVNGTPVLDLYHVLDAPELAENMGMDRISVKQSLFLDIDASGSLAFGVGKNVKLGKLREALGQNDAGQTWNFNMLSGAGPLRVKVSSKPDKDDSSIIYNSVTKTTAF